MTDDLKLIKKLYGEDMMHFCRDNFSTILDMEPNLLVKLLTDNFDANKFLYDDINKNELQSDFKNYIYNLLNFEADENKEDEIINIKTPEELMSEAGYMLYKCETEKDIKQFKKYYAEGEELCTFRGGRLKRCYVFFAVKENVDKIKRKNFKIPHRQDEYGTSVISIQFTKDPSHILSIKNRYNHTVGNPDATFSNNLDNIIEGLTDSFAMHYRMKQTSTNNGFEIPGYVKANDGKYYKYNYEINNVYYCVDNVIIDNFEVKRYNKERYIIMDYFIVDMKEKIIKCYKEIIDDFVTHFIDLKRIEVKKLKNNKIISITHGSGKKSIIKIDKENNIIGFKSDEIETIEDRFLFYNDTLSLISMPNVRSINNDFLSYNNKINNIKFTKLTSIGNNFMLNNSKLENISLNVLESVGDAFLSNSWRLKEINLPNLECVGNDFMNNSNVSKINFPKLRVVHSNFMADNMVIRKLFLPNLEIVGNFFMGRNTCISSIYLPKLKSVGELFMAYNNSLKTLNLPNLFNIGDKFMCTNECLITLNMPNVNRIGNYFLFVNNSILEINMPNVNIIGDDFLSHNNKISVIDMPNLKFIGEKFLEKNKSLRRLYIPNLEYGSKINNIKFKKASIWFKNKVYKLDKNNYNIVKEKGKVYEKTNNKKSR